MAKKTLGNSKSKPTLREYILSLPDAPIGERSCDIPLTEEENRWLQAFFEGRRRVREAGEELCGDGTQKPDFWRRALEVLRTTGLSIDEFDRLGADTSVEVKILQAAAMMKKQQRGDIEATIQKKHLLPDPSSDKPNSPAGATGITRPKLDENGLLVSDGNNPGAGRCKKLNRSQEIALSQYKVACQKDPNITTDKQAYAYWDERESRDLPKYETWRTYLRQARRITDTRKHNTRRNREHGSSIVNEKHI